MRRDGESSPDTATTSEWSALVLAALVLGMAVLGAVSGCGDDLVVGGVLPALFTPTPGGSPTITPF